MKSLLNEGIELLENEAGLSDEELEIKAGEFADKCAIAVIGKLPRKYNAVEVVEIMKLQSILDIDNYKMVVSLYDTMFPQPSSVEQVKSLIESVQADIENGEETKTCTVMNQKFVKVNDNG